MNFLFFQTAGADTCHIQVYYFFCLNIKIYLFINLLI